jgi:Icc-related predicted phosphoesterase
MRLLIFSDVHGDAGALKRLMEREADYYFAAGDLANWGRGLEKMGPIMEPKAVRVYVIPGNHESASDVAAFCEQFGFYDFHAKSGELDGHTIAALGYSNPTPFHTPGEYSEEQIAEKLSALDSPEILICHCPPKDTKLDEAFVGHHYGSTAVREFIEAKQPAYFFCGHIHEAMGSSEEIGRTKGFNVGKQGYLLEL